MGKKIGNNISKNLSGKYIPGMLAMRQKLLDHAKHSAIDVFKTTSKREIQKSAEAIGYLIGNKIANKITKAPENSQENNSETVINKHDKEMLKKRYIYLQKKDKKLLMNYD